MQVCTVHIVIFCFKSFYSLPLTVCERDALCGHFEVNGRRCRQGVCGQRVTDCLGDGLRTRERLHVHRADVEDIARWRTDSW